MLHRDAAFRSAVGKMLKCKAFKVGKDEAQARNEERAAMRAFLN